MARQRQISKIIPFVRDDEGEYRAEIDGIKFHILWATKSGSATGTKTWAYTANTVEGENLRDKSWLTWSNQRWAVSQCENILAKRRAQEAA